MQHFFVLLFLFFALVGARLPALAQSDTPLPPPATPTELPGLRGAAARTLAAEETPTAVITTSLTPTPQRNPAELSRREVLVNLGRGGLAAAGFFALMGIYRLLQKIFGRR